MSNTESTVNYLNDVNAFFGAESNFLAQGKEKHFIRLEKLDEPFKRADGKRVSFQMEYRELSETCTDADDESWCCVRSNEFTYWSATELKAMGLNVSHKNPERWVPENYYIFEHVNIF